MPLVTLCWFAFSASAADHPTALMDLLNAYEVVPDAPALLALGPEVDLLLQAVANDVEVPLTRRGRAVSSLRYFPNPANQQWLVVALGSSPEGFLRGKAALALADAFDDAAIPAIEAAWVGADIQLRVALATALGLIESEVANQSAAAHLQAEREPAVRTALEKAAR